MHYTHKVNYFSWSWSTAYILLNNLYAKKVIKSVIMNDLIIKNQ